MLAIFAFLAPVQDYEEDHGSQHPFPERSRRARAAHLAQCRSIFPQYRIGADGAGEHVHRRRRLAGRHAGCAQPAGFRLRDRLRGHAHATASQAQAELAVYLNPVSWCASITRVRSPRPC